LNRQQSRLTLPTRTTDYRCEFVSKNFKVGTGKYF
jgi:hypothetical protein